MDQKIEERLRKNLRRQASVLDAVLLAGVGGGLRDQELPGHLDAGSDGLIVIGRTIWNKIRLIER